MITPAARPRLAPKARLRVDPRSGKHMLLYPERGLELTASAARIAKLCTGELSVTEIVARLASEHADADHRRIETEVIAFLTSLEERGLLATPDGEAAAP